MKTDIIYVYNLEKELRHFNKQKTLVIKKVARALTQQVFQTSKN